MTISTDLDICNSALYEVGIPLINSLSESSFVANVLNSIYAPTKRFVLSQFPWPFATKDKKLYELNNDDQQKGFTNCFLLPADFIKPLKCSSDLPYEISKDDGMLFINTDDVILTYIADVDESEFSFSFKQALVYLLAAHLSMYCLDDAMKHDYYYTKYLIQLKEVCQSPTNNNE